MHRQGLYHCCPKEDLQGAAAAIPPLIHQWESQLRNRRDQHSEALWEAMEALPADALEAAHALQVGH